MAPPYCVPDPLDSWEAWQRSVHADLPTFSRPALVAERWRAQAAIAAIDPTASSARLDVAWTWWWERYEAVLAALRRDDPGAR